MDDARQTFSYRVCGFGDHTEWKTVEFMDEIDEEQVCNWCGVVSAELVVLPCLHVVCEECRTVVYQFSPTVCRIDKQALISDTKVTGDALKQALGRRTVRCVNVGRGCHHTDCLWSLTNHLRDSCAFYLKECPKCDDAVVLKDLVSHSKKCKGVAGVFLRSADAQSLLEDMGNARNELEHRFSSTRSNVRDAVGVITEQLEILRCQLTASSQGKSEDVMLNGCNQ